MASGSSLPPQRPGGFPPPQDPYSVPPAGADQPRSSSASNTIWIALAVVALMMFLCGGVLVALLLPAVSAARAAAQRMTRSNNVKQIGLGIHNYHAAYNQLPFTVNSNSAGETTIGWRLALAPFVEGQRQWESLDVDQPWDEANNLAVQSDPPQAFQSLLGEPGQTNIFAILSPQGMFPPTSQTKVTFRDVADGLSLTVMLIELPNRHVPWSSTENLTPEEAFAAIGELRGSEVAHLLLGDGAVRAVSGNLDRQTFDAMVTRAGAEAVPIGF